MGRVRHAGGTAAGRGPAARAFAWLVAGPLAFIVMALWVAVAVAAVRYLPPLGQSASTVGDITPAHLPALRVEQRSAAAFGSTVLSRVAVVQRDPGGLSQDVRDASAKQALGVAQGQAKSRYPGLHGGSSGPERQARHARSPRGRHDHRHLPLLRPGEQLGRPGEDGRALRPRPACHAGGRGRRGHGLDPGADGPGRPDLRPPESRRDRHGPAHRPDPRGDVPVVAGARGGARRRRALVHGRAAPRRVGRSALRVRGSGRAAASDGRVAARYRHRLRDLPAGRLPPAARRRAYPAPARHGWRSRRTRRSSRRPASWSRRARPCSW